MRGFRLIEPEQTAPTTGNTQPTHTASVDIERQDNVTILTLELLRGLIQDPEFEIETTEDEIKDRSKGDALSKFLFVVQISWFVVQCIARRVEGLSLTQLELTTLALASVNGISIFLWWEKPLGAQTAVQVTLHKRLSRRNKSEPQIVPLEREDSAEGRGSGFPINQYFLVIMCPFLLLGFLLGGCWMPVQVVGAILLLPLVIPLLFLALTIAFAMFALTTISDLLLSSQSLVDAHVHTFYAPKHKYSKYSHFFLLVVLGPIFGGIHFAAWNFPFPSHTYQQLWRITTLVITIIPISTPIIIFIILIIRNLTLRDFVLPSLYNFNTTTRLVTALSAVAYVVARLILLGLALALLKNQPLSAFIVLDWNIDYPHF